MSFLNATIRAFHMFAESLNLLNLYFMARKCICILFLPEQWKPCTKLTFFTFEKRIQLFFGYVHVLPILPTFGLLMSEAELKGKGIMGCHLSLSF